VSRWLHFPQYESINQSIGRSSHSRYFGTMIKKRVGIAGLRMEERAPKLDVLGLQLGVVPHSPHANIARNPTPSGSTQTVMCTCTRRRVLQPKRGQRRNPFRATHLQAKSSPHQTTLMPTLVALQSWSHRGAPPHPGRWIGPAAPI
jgi:hypothetical protein